MKLTSILPLVNWGMGAIIIGVFAVVCIAMVLIIYNMVNSDKKNTKETE
jgi:cell division protein FtsX